MIMITETRPIITKPHLDFLEFYKGGLQTEQLKLW